MFVRRPFLVPSPESIRERNQKMADEDMAVFESIDRILEPCSKCGSRISIDEPRDSGSKSHLTPNGCDRDTVRGIMSL